MTWIMDSRMEAFSARAFGFWLSYAYLKERQSAGDFS